MANRFTFQSQSSRQTVPMAEMEERNRLRSPGPTRFRPSIPSWFSVASSREAGEMVRAPAPASAPHPDPYPYPAPRPSSSVYSGAVALTTDVRHSGGLDYAGVPKMPPFHIAAQRLPSPRLHLNLDLDLDLNRTSTWTTGSVLSELEPGLRHEQQAAVETGIGTGVGIGIGIGIGAGAGADADREARARELLARPEVVTARPLSAVTADVLYPRRADRRTRTCDVPETRASGSDGRRRRRRRRDRAPRSPLGWGWGSGSGSGSGLGSRETDEERRQRRRRRRREREQRAAGSSTSRRTRSSSPPQHFLFCFPWIQSRRVRTQVLRCFVSGLFLASMLVVYLALSVTRNINSSEFTVLLILMILCVTIFFCHGLIRLCLLMVKNQRNNDDGAAHRGGAGGYAIPRQPIRVLLARDEEAAGLESETTKVSPPAYGLWRESVRVDPNRIYWARNEAAAEAEHALPPPHLRPGTSGSIHRPPSYASDDGVSYVVEAQPRSIAPSTDVPLAHPSETGRAGRPPGW